jgi:hypothetical protein
MTLQQHILMTIVGILGLPLLTGCSAATSDADLTTDPAPSIVWSDDFEDGNLDGWEIFYAGNFWVDNGVLSSKTEGDLYHLSTVLSGTWSFDLYLISNPGLTHEVQFTEGGTNYQMISVENNPNTQIWVTTQMDPEEEITSNIDLGEELTGWHHFDVTRDESGWIKVYMDGQFLIEHFDNRPFSVDMLTVYYCCNGPFLDNIIVQDQVRDFPPQE